MTDKHAGGRPTKYNSKVHPGIVLKLAAVGMTDEDMAEVLGVARSNFAEWKNKHPEFQDAVTEGKENPIRDVEDALYRLCKGYTYEEGGRKKVKHPDIRAIQFYLKNVVPDKWREKLDVDANLTSDKLLVIVREGEDANGDSDEEDS